MHATSLPSGLAARPATGGALRRLAGVACLAGVAATHLVDLPHHAQETPYLAAMFLALAIASVALAWALLTSAEPQAWSAAGWLSVTAIAGYVISRTIGLPGLDHEGDWTEAAGLLAVGFEGGLVALAIAAGGRVPAFPRPAIGIVATALVGVVAGGAAEQVRLGPAAVHHHDHGERGGAGAAHDHGAAGHDHAGVAAAGHGHGGATAATGHGDDGAAAAAGHHHHDARTGIGHLQVEPSGHLRFGTRTLDVDATTPREQHAADRLLRRSRASARSRFPSMQAAQALGYRIDPVRPPDDPGILRPHLTNPALLRDGHTLDPRRPESLVYQHRPDGSLELVAFMFRAPTGAWTPTAAGRFVRWHAHGGCVRPSAEVHGTTDARCPAGRILHRGPTMMVHVWLEHDLRSGFATIPPRRLR
jgi:hypothetical protein